MSEAQVEEEHEAAPAPVPVVVKPGTAEKQYRETEDQDVITFLQSIGPQGSMRIRLERHKPEFGVWKGQRIDIAGSCETYDRHITEEDIKADYGGGVYDLKVLKPNAQGSFVFFRSKRIRIAGPPRMEKHAADLPPPEMATSQAESTPLAQQALSTMTGLLEKAEKRASASGNDSGSVASAIEVATSPLLSSIKDMRDDNRALLKELAVARQPLPAAPVDNAANKLLEKFVDGGDQRLDAIRTQFDSERRQLTTFWEGQLARAQDDTKRQVDTIKSGHEREIKGIERSHDQTLEMLKTSNAMIVEGLKREIVRLERELGGKEKELAEVRGQKTKSLPEQIQEINLLKDLIKGDSDDEEKGSTAERIIDMVVNSNPVAAIASRIAAAPQQQTQQAPQATQQPQDPFAHIPVGQPFLYNGATMVRAVMPNGQVAVVPLKKKKKAVVAATPGQEGEAAAAPPVEGAIPTPPDELPNIDPGDLALAVTYLESAIQSRSSPVEFAGSVMSMAPAFANVLRKFGADKILGMATISDSSPIVTQRGRTFIREVVEALLAT